MSAYRQFKAEVYTYVASMAQALANPHRLELLDLLAQAPKTVDRLAAEAQLSITNASQHLQALKRAHLVQAEREGTHMVYSLADPAIPDFLRALRVCAERRLPELDQVIRSFVLHRDDMITIDRERLLQEALAGTIVVLDVRPHDEFMHAHLPGARSVPLDELEERLAEIPRDRKIVAYCRGPYCVLAMQAVDRLRDLGFEAVRLVDSVSDWGAHGLPVVHDADPAARTPSASD